MIWPPQEIWNDPSSLITYYTTSSLSIRPIAGIIIASVIVSILGSYATLLLLGRTTGRGIRSHALQGLAAVAFAVVAVWSMHFLSFQGLQLVASPSVGWYLKFSPGFTVLSLFVPLLVTYLAFWFLGNQDEFSYWRTIAAGCFLGLTIGLMHYSASFQLPNFIITYHAYTVVLSLLIAMLAATVAFVLFFRLRSQWQESVWKRGLCAVGLAVAVCGMHFTGVAGSSYTVKLGTTVEALDTGKSESLRITIAISVMCAVLVAFCIAITIADYRVERDIRKRARMIVIASAAFDKQGRILVRADGMLPMQVIETDAVLKDVLEELDPRRPTFQWLYSISFQWATLIPFIPRIHANIMKRRGLSPAEARKAGKASKGTKADELLQFRTRFCEAAYQLSEELDIPLQTLGVMFDRVMTTGTRKPMERTEKEQNMRGDDESSIHGITLNLPDSEGVMLVVVRELADTATILPGTAPGMIGEKQGDSAEKYLAKGYRLSDVKYFSAVLSERVGVPRPEMDTFLGACKTYAKRGCKPVVQAGGCYLALYGVRPSGTEQGGVDVLVYNFARHQIPAYRLPEVHGLTPAMRNWTREHAGMTLQDILIKCNDAITKAEADDNMVNEDGDRISIDRTSQDESLLDMITAFSIAAEALGQAMRTWPNLYSLARLSPEILDVPSSVDDSTVPAQMLVLEVVLPPTMGYLNPSLSRSSISKMEESQGRVTQTDKPPQPFVMTPFALFSIAQFQILQGKSAHAFARDVTAQLTKLYSAAPTDVLAELDEVDTLKGGAVKNNKSITFSQENNQANKTKFKPNMIQDLLESRRRSASQAHSLHSSGYAEEEDDKELLGNPTRGPRSIGGMSAGRTVLDSTAEDYETTMTPGRARTDGWHTRSMRTLERSEQGSTLLGSEW